MLSFYWKKRTRVCEQYCIFNSFKKKKRKREKKKKEIMQKVTKNVDAKKKAYNTIVQTFLKKHLGLCIGAAENDNRNKL